MVRSKTSMQISIETKRRLDSLKITPGESYEQTILRLLDTKLHGRELDYIISDHNSDHTLKVRVNWALTEENIMYYTQDGKLSLEFPEYVFEDDEEMASWNEFEKYLFGLKNLINILAILDYEEHINAGEVTLKRIN